MRTLESLYQQPQRVERARCYSCYRRLEDCYCAAIPVVDNQTHVLILQHIRERFHPFNTARIAHKALSNSTLLVDHTSNIAARLQFKPSAGLLYPGPEAKFLAELSPAERPGQLVILDGTWHHAKTFVRDIPALAQLPRYQLAPELPSRYRIRRVPHATALSTIEAIVAALTILEPNLQNLDTLLTAFDSIVDAQLAHPKPGGWRKKAKRNRSS